MIERLKEAGLHHCVKDELSKKVFDRFVNRVAGQEQEGTGLWSAWTLSLYDELLDIHPVPPVTLGLEGVVNRYFNEVIDAVTPDAEVAASAKALMKQSMKALKKK
jgi:hypothetical protein